MKTELEGRTKDFSVRIVRLIRSFPKTVDGIEVGRQLLRSGTSIGANYREANRAESKPDFIHKVGIAEKEASETVCWLEICEAAPLGEANEVRELLNPNSEVGEPARPGRCRPRPRGQAVTRDTATNAWNFSLRPSFPRGRGKPRPRRARSLSISEFGLKEATELLAIITTIGRKAKGRVRQLASSVILLTVFASACFSLSRFPAFRF